MRRFLFLLLALTALLIVGCGAKDSPKQTTESNKFLQSPISIADFLVQFSELTAETATIEEARQNGNMLVYYITDKNVGDRFTLTFQSDDVGSLVSVLFTGNNNSLSAFPAFAMNICTALPLPNNATWLEDFNYFISINEYTAYSYGDWLVVADPSLGGETALTVHYIVN